jgi:type IV pilus assembly protein PilW
MSTLPRIRRHRRRPAAGFSLIELMIALAIALFLIAGMVLIFQNTRSTYTTEKSLAQLEDNERLAMTMIADVIQSAGYYPNPAQNFAQNALPASPDFPTAQNSQDLLSNIAANTNAEGDTISVRYAADPTDALMNCMGQTDTSGGLISWDNTLSVDPNGFLTCQVWDSADGKTSAPTELVGGFATGAGVTSMSFLYGVNTGTASNGSCVDTYMNATQVTAGSYWPDVCSVTVTLKFVNPIDTTKQITFTRVIALMNQAGVNNS